MASSRMVSLLGLLAAAAFQNRDKLGELLGGLTGGAGERSPGNDPTAAPPEGGLGSILSGLGLGGLLAGAKGPNGGVSTALGDLVNQFSANGYAETARAWVATGPNPPLAPSDLQQALGSDAIQELLQKTGIPKDELLNRLSAVLPAAVDTLTPNGRIPAHGKAQRFAERV